MRDYEDKVSIEVYKWQRKMLKSPSTLNVLTVDAQNKLNSLYPEKYRELMCDTVTAMVQAVVGGVGYISCTPLVNISLEERDKEAKKVIEKYKRVGMVEGASTGMGGIFVGMMDFPLLISIKMKMLYELSAVYGYDTTTKRERLYMLLIFQLAFSNFEERGKLLKHLEKWEHYQRENSPHANEFDWDKFQQGYRDYLDIAKLMQLLPIIGAPVGAYTNQKLVGELGTVAINVFHMRYIQHFK
ncbi:MAG: hypothetical protein ATN36_02590 [Epulopiscium sp. Nele67-Bin005]|nr:MAG: hypothetical protein ATN36_02590 [Epulopiscium sp. Nele67-Bin005]